MSIQATALKYEMYEPSWMVNTQQNMDFIIVTSDRGAVMHIYWELPQFMCG